MLRLTLAGLVTIAALGCERRDSTGRTKELIESCPDTKTRTAEQRGKTVTLVVTGDHPNDGYKTWLKKTSRDDVTPPEFSLTHQKPEQQASDVVTTFNVKETFDSDRPIETVVLHDGKGKHEIRVTMVPK